MDAKLIIINMPSKDTGRARQFYAALLGRDDFARALTEEITVYQRIISSDGIDLNLTLSRWERDTVTAFFAVDDLRATLERLEAAGGQILVPPFPLPVSPRVLDEYRRAWARIDPKEEALDSIGECALVVDPDGNTVGVVQLAHMAHRHFRWGEYRKPLESEQEEEQRQAQRLGQALEAGAEQS
jgi:predicted enzyme related to lactoylglutathione lyase